MSSHLLKGYLSRSHRLKRSSTKVDMKRQNYDYFLVLDFEATCEESITIPNQEIIEFPVLKIDSKTFDVIGQFHEYVRPIHNAQLTDFCTKLTGITQEMVDQCDSFPEVFGRFQQWIINDVGLDKTFLFVTCGDWDLKSMLPGQCQRENIILPDYFSSWMNIKKTFAHVTGEFHKGIIPMLKMLEIEHVGRLHSGIDDCKNIANILAELAKFGCVFRTTSRDKGHKGTPHRPMASLGASPPLQVPTPQSTAKESPECLYPSLASHRFTEDTSSPLYQPYDKGDVDQFKDLGEDQAVGFDYGSSPNDNAFGKDLSNRSGKHFDKDLYEKDLDPYQRDLDKDDQDIEPFDSEYEKPSQAEDCDASFSRRTKQTCPDYPTIILKLKENISSKLFNSRNRDELLPLCASGKYLELMEEEDRKLVEARLRFYYLGLCYGWRVASKDSKLLSASAVGIDVPLEVLPASKRHGHSKPRH